LAPDSWKYEQLQAAQLVDLNPGIRAGLFWTVPVTADSVRVDVDRGTATMHLETVGVFDYTSLPQSLASTATGHPSVASMTVKWSVPPGAPTETLDDSAGWLYSFHRAANATIVFRGWHVPWTARPGATPDVPLAFRSGLSSPTDTSGQVTIPFGTSFQPDNVPRAVIGRERSGVYY
jgi:hypothetical protein